MVASRDKGTEFPLRETWFVYVVSTRGVTQVMTQIFIKVP